MNTPTKVVTLSIKQNLFYFLLIPPMGLLEKKRDIEEEIARTQKNKKTEHHLGRLKGKLAQIKTQILEASSKSKATGDGFDVRKSGDVRVALVGFPSVGKSSFLGKFTTTQSATAAYEFTTLTCIPGILEYKGTEIQILDLPGILEGASEGKGRGRQVIATARTADLILLMMDAEKAEVQRRLLTAELESVGLRLNCAPPKISLKKKPSGTRNLISYSCTCGPLTRGLSERLVCELLREYKIHNAEVVIREDCPVEGLIDVLEGNRRYVPALHVYNKIDNVCMEEIDRLARLPHSVVMSLAWELNFEAVRRGLWEHLGLVRVYTRRRGEAMPDFEKPFILESSERKEARVSRVCDRIHKDMVDKFKYAVVWGTSCRYQPQRVGLRHALEDEDVIMIVSAG